MHLVVVVSNPVIHAVEHAKIKGLATRLTTMLRELTYRDPIKNCAALVHCGEAETSTRVLNGGEQLVSESGRVTRAGTEIPAIINTRITSTTKMAMTAIRIKIRRASGEFIFTALFF
jgi:hypothetical protein